MEAATTAMQQTDTATGIVECASARLAAAGVASARLDAEVLLAHACGINRTALYSGWRRTVPPVCRARFDVMLQRRLAREPLQYIVGRQEFWSMDFVVTPDVLIPRPETELLVERTLRMIDNAVPVLCDLGTGSGCIAVALARELPQAEIWALDISAAALGVAETNARQHDVAERIHFRLSDLFAVVSDVRFDTIISNPPYVCTDALQHAQPELKWEPAQALDGGATGIRVIERFVTESYDRLKPGGWLLVELGADQRNAAEDLARTAGFSSASVEPDYAGLSRILLARR